MSSVSFNSFINGPRTNASKKRKKIESNNINEENDERKFILHFFSLTFDLDALLGFSVFQRGSLLTRMK